MTPEQRRDLRVLLGAVLVALFGSWIMDGVRERPQSMKEREAEIRRIATEQVCRALVEARLVATCSLTKGP